MKRYTNIEQLRADKVYAKLNLNKSVKRLKSDTAYSVAPKSKVFSNSSSRVMNVIGYGIMAYNIVSNVRGIYRFVTRWL